MYSSTIPTVYYNEDECNVQDKVNKLFKAYTGTSYVVMLASLFSAKIVGLELFGILQLSYFVLASHSFLNIYMAPLANFRLFNGLNL